MSVFCFLFFLAFSALRAKNAKFLCGEMSDSCAECQFFAFYFFVAPARWAGATGRKVPLIL